MSMELLESRPEARDYDLERLIMLSDGVFAIAITLLALELRVPEHWDETSLSDLWRLMWRPFLAFLFSFFVIAVYWINHRRMFGRLKSADMPLTALNLLLLGLITLAPVATSLAYEAGPGSAGFIVYVAALSAIGFANALIWVWAAFGNPALFRTPPTGFQRLMALAAVVVIPVITLLLLIAVTTQAAWAYFGAIGMGAGMGVLRRVAHARRAAA